jgi:ribosomal protein S18 acetylase RimI-like enzyme
MAGAWSVRPARPEDAAAVARIRVVTWRSAYRGLMPDHVLDALDIDELTARWGQYIAECPAKGQELFVAETADGQVVGYAAVGPERDGESGRGEVYAIYVEPSRQARGAGRELMAAGTAWLAARGLLPFILWVLTANQPARRFYERLGGQVCGRRTVTIEVPLDETAYCWAGPVTP